MLQVAEVGFVQGSIWGSSAKECSRARLASNNPWWMFAHQGRKQVFFVAKVAIYYAKREACLIGDVGHPRSDVTFAREDVPCRLKDLFLVRMPLDVLGVAGREAT